MNSQRENPYQSEPTERILRGWIWIVGFGVLGVLIGLGFSLLIPPRYEAKASFAVNIVYGITEELELVVEDRVLDRVWQLAVSDETLENTKTSLDINVGHFPAWETIDQLRDHIRLDARLSRWELIGIHRDPRLSSEIANTWRKVTLDRLDQALEHAWKAYSIQGVVFDVECVRLLNNEEVRHLWTCVHSGPGVSPGELIRFRREIEASHGILPIVTYEPVQRASIPESPALWPRGLMAFFGGSAGLILGLVLIFIKPSLFPSGQSKIKYDQHLKPEDS